MFKALGALSVVECWGDDIPEGEHNSMHTAVQRKPDETVVFSWIAWPSKAVRDTGVPKVMAELELQADMSTMPFDGQRMIFGGFDVIVDA